MTTEHVEAPATWTVGAARSRHIRDVGHAQGDRSTPSTSSIRSTAASCTWSRCASCCSRIRPAPLLEIGDRILRSPSTPWTDREEAARLIAKYDLLAVPVVDDGGHLLGIVTVDDVIDAMVKEQTEDVQQARRHGGARRALHEDRLRDDDPQARRLAVRALPGEMLTATAMQHFEGELSRAIVLTLFIPLIMSSGGNSGSQATSLIIRALALRELRLRDWWRVALRELPSGIALGAILGVIGIVRIVLWQLPRVLRLRRHWLLSPSRSAGALVGIVTFGSLAGSMLPFILRRLGFDPASASAPFVATLVDVTGLVIYFTVAFVVLRGTLALGERARGAAGRPAGGRGRFALFLSRADFERADEALDARNASGDRLGLFLLLSGLHGPAEIHGRFSADDTETGQVRLVLRDQARLHLGLDPGVRPRIDGRAPGDYFNGEDHGKETPADPTMVHGHCEELGAVWASPVSFRRNSRSSPSGRARILGFRRDRV